MGEAFTRHSLRPLFSGGPKTMHNSGAIAPREGDTVFPQFSVVMPRFKRGIQYAAAYRLGRPVEPGDDSGSRHCRLYIWLALAHASYLTARNISPLAKAASAGHKNSGHRDDKKREAENELTIKGKAYIAGIFEHPTRHAPDKSTAQLHAEVARGAIEDAGLSKADIDGYFLAGDAPGGAWPMVDYLGLKVRHIDSTDTGGCSYLIHLGHAAEAIAAGKCSIALVTLAGKPRTGPMPARPAGPEADFEAAYGATTHNAYGMCAMRHMHDYGTTSEQLAWIKVAASHHAQHNPNAFLKDVVTVEDVVNSPMISDPLHRLDCCVVTDGGGALIVTSEEIARSLKKPLVRLIGHGEAMKGPRGGKDIDLTYSAGVWSGPRAFEEAGVTPQDIKYASIYDSFTITVLMQLEDLGFCRKGEGGKFVADGNLISGVGKLPFNTDGGGLCSNHPVNRGGMTKIIEAVRQLRGEAHPKVQVKNCDLAIAHGTGGLLGVRHAASTCILERV
jgi:acetyl-CoA C-acetyltransferase